MPNNFRIANEHIILCLFTGEETKEALRRLRVHIHRGCLASIPPTGGTNRNERIHRHLNASALNVGRIGPELAHSLLKGIVFCWNEKKEGRGWSMPYSNCHATQPLSATKSVAESVVSNTAAQDSQLRSGRAQSSAAVYAQEVHDAMHGLEHMWLQLSEDGQFKANCDAIKLAMTYNYRHEILRTIKAMHENLDETSVQIHSYGPMDGINSLDDIIQNMHTESFLEGSIMIMTGCPTFTYVPLHISSSPTLHLVHVSANQTTWKCWSALKPAAYMPIAASPGTVTKTLPMTRKKLSCRCGENASRKRKQPNGCCAYTTKGTTRCHCLAEKQSCTHACGCKGCHNPKGRNFGRGIGAPRRPKFSSQRPTAKKIKGVDFITAVGDSCPQGRFSVLESLCVSLIHNHASSGSAALRLYVEVQKICTRESCANSVRNKGLNQIIGKLTSVAGEIQGLHTMLENS